MRELSHPIPQAEAPRRETPWDRLKRRDWSKFQPDKKMVGPLWEQWTVEAFMWIGLAFGAWALLGAPGL